MIRTNPRYRWERRLMGVLVFIVLRSRRNLTVEGLKNVPAAGPAIVLCNHIATMDPPMVGSRIQRLDVHYMAKSELFRRRWARFLLYGWNAFPVVRHTADRAAIGHALRVLAEGHVLVIFPEGSRSGDATLGRAFPGVGFLARRSGAPIIAAAIWGSEKVLPKGRILPSSAPVHIRFGEPVTLAELAGPGRLRNQEATDLLMGEVAALLPGPYRGVYDGRPLAGVVPRGEASTAA